MALLSLAACNKELGPEAGDITIDACIGAMTKVSYDGASTSFTAGDQIAVYAWMGSASTVPDSRVVDGVRNILDSDGKWTPASLMRWKTVTDAHYFLGVYPAKDITDFTADAYTLDPAAYTASDLLIATNLTGVKASDGAVALNFDHTMAKLNVNLKFRSQWDATPTVTSVTVKARKTATVNYLTKAVTATGDATAVDIPAAATAAAGYALSYSGLQVPQTGVTTVIVTIAGKEFVFESATDIPLESGKYTTLGLIVGKNEVELSSVEVLDWPAGTDLPGGEAMMQRDYVDMGEVIINGIPKHIYWATCNIGAENPWDYGDYFAWGATATRTSYDWANYPFMQAGQSDWKHITKYTLADGMTDAIWYDGGGNFIGDGKTTLADYDYVDDAARQIWGGDWRVPTFAEWTALRDATLYDCVWKTDYNGSGKNGMLVTRKTGTGPCAGNSIFLPATGYWDGATLDGAGTRGFYWSSSLNKYGSYDARSVSFYSGGVSPGGGSRCFGKPLRPVKGDTPPALGDLYYSDGTSSPELIPGKTPIGVIAYLGTDSFTENGTNVGGSAFKGHGLVLCLKNAAVNPKWSTEKVSKFPGNEVTDVAGLKRTTNVSGYTNTLTLTQDAETAAKYPAAAAARSFVGLPAPAGTTGWFLPSIQQWVKIMEGLGGLQDGAPGYEVWFDNDHVSIDRIEAAMAKAGAAGTAYDSMKSYMWYWASTERSADETVDLGVRASGTGSGYGLYWSDVSKTYQSYNVRSRPVLAF